MQTLIITLGLLLLIFIQTILPVKCDLLLISIIVLSLRKNDNETETLSYSFFGGFILDALSGFSFLNTLSKTIAAVVLNFLRPIMAFDESTLVYLLVLGLTPASYLIEVLFSSFFYHHPFGIMALIFGMLKLLLVNLLFTPVVCWLWEKVARISERF